MNKTQICTDKIYEILQDGKEHESTPIREMLLADGYSLTMIHRATKTLRIVKTKQGWQGEYTWRLPTLDEIDAEDGIEIVIRGKASAIYKYPIWKYIVQNERRLKMEGEHK